MLSEKQIKALKNGAYGMTRDGSKAIFIGEEFNLERALNGEPLKSTSDDMCWIIGKSKTDNQYVIQFDDGDTGTLPLNTIETFIMWKEPEPVKPTAGDLPKPIKEFRSLEKVFYVGLSSSSQKYTPFSLTKSLYWTDKEDGYLHNGCLYATKEDCQKVCDWLMNR